MAFFFDPVKEMPLKIKDEDEVTKFERKIRAKREKAAKQQREGWLNEYSDFGDE